MAEHRAVRDIDATAEQLYKNQIGIRHEYETGADGGDLCVGWVLVGGCRHSSCPGFDVPRLVIWSYKRGASRLNP